MTNINSSQALTDEAIAKVVIFQIGAQKFALDVELLNDVILKPAITYIPLAAANIKGCINLRGRFVTVIDIDEILEVTDGEVKEPMILVIEYQEELYGFRADIVNRVYEVEESQITNNPSNISSQWLQLLNGTFYLDNELIILLDATKLMATFLNQGKS
jgi:purine-binding chemotaxis protein CheW